MKNGPNAENENGTGERVLRQKMKIGWKKSSRK